MIPPSSLAPTPARASETFHESSATRPAITDDEVRRVALEHDVCERTVVRALAGLTVRGRAGERARRAASTLRASTATRTERRSA